MKRLILGGAFFAGLLLTAGAARAERPKFYGEIEAWHKGDGFEETEEFLDTEIRPNVDSVSFETRGGAGVRLGFWLPTKFDRLVFGGSLGFLIGPGMEVEVRESSPAPGTIDLDVNSTFLRALFEVRKGFAVADGIELRLRGGLGLAQGRIENEGTSTGVFAGSVVPDSDTWGGFTWEVGPSIAFIGERLGFDIGLVYAAFPKMKESAEDDEFHWRPLGLRASVAF